MKVMHYKDEEATLIDNDVAKGVSARLLIGKNDGATNFCMRMFQLSEGGHTPRHSHEWEHEIFFHSGKGEVLCGDTWRPVEAGSIAFIPGDTEHQIKNTGSEPLTFVCLIPSGFPEL